MCNIYDLSPLYNTNTCNCQDLMVIDTLSAPLPVEEPVQCLVVTSKVVTKLLRSRFHKTSIITINKRMEILIATLIDFDFVASIQYDYVGWSGFWFLRWEVKLKSEKFKRLSRVGLVRYGCPTPTDLRLQSLHLQMSKLRQNLEGF